MSKEIEKCKATIAFGDDFGDNECTFRCKLEKGHSGKHKVDGWLYGQKYILEWEDKVRKEDEKVE